MSVHFWEEHPELVLVSQKLRNHLVDVNGCSPGALLGPIGILAPESPPGTPVDIISWRGCVHHSPEAWAQSLSTEQYLLNCLPTTTLWTLDGSQAGLCLAKDKSLFNHLELSHILG